MSLSLGNITVLSDGIGSGTLLIVSYEKITHGYDPFFFDHSFCAFSGRMVKLVQPVWVVAEGDLKYRASHFDSDLVLSLAKLVHFDVLPDTFF